MVTGGARRVGRELVLHFAALGYDIALHCHHSTGEAEETKAEIEALGVECAIFPTDLRDLKKLPELMRQVHNRFPHLSVLINSASTFPRVAYKNTEVDFYHDCWAINFSAPFFLTQAFAKSAGQGSVVNIIDTAITGYRTSHFVYLLAKKALAEFTQMAARDLAPAIRVNGVCPGMMLPTEGTDNRDVDKYEASLPARQMASPRQCCEVVQHLVETPYLYGQLIYIDGGERLV